MILQVEFGLNFARDFTSRENIGLEKETAIYFFSTTTHAAASYFYLDNFIDFKFKKKFSKCFPNIDAKNKIEEADAKWSKNI